MHTNHTTPQISRRSLLRISLAAAAGGGALALAACTTDTATTPTSRPTTMPDSTTTTGSERRLLLAYFSRAGENYWHGGRRNLTVGNTQVLAGMIADRVDCDLYRIEAADPYSDDYDDTVARNVAEQNAHARPRIAKPLPRLAGYDDIILASPIWNVRPPMIMSTFLDQVDLTGKRLFPVVTYAVSGLGQTVQAYTALAPNASIGRALAVQGEDVAHSSDNVNAWASSVGP